MDKNHVICVTDVSCGPKQSESHASLKFSSHYHSISWRWSVALSQSFSCVCVSVSVCAVGEVILCSTASFSCLRLY